MQKPNKTIKTLSTNERGNVAIMFGLTSMIAVAVVGGSVDFGRAYRDKSRMQNALDAAVVSGIAKYRETADWTDAKSEALSIFQAMFSNAVSPTAQNPNPSAARDQPIVSFSQNGSQLIGTATMKSTTPFLHATLGKHLDVTANSNGVPPSGKMLEVALMVDLTGSMGWSAASGATSTPCGTITNPSSKIDYLK